MTSRPLLLTNIPQLLTFAGPPGARTGKQMGETGLVKDAAVLMSGGKIICSGTRKEVSLHPLSRKARVLEAGGVVLPGFCDSHTHPVFAGPRTADFLARCGVKNPSGPRGIISSAEAVRKTPLSELVKLVKSRLRLFSECGTTSVEAKSGYGLSLSAELKSLEAIRLAAAGNSLRVVPTLLAAHSVPPEFSSAEDYSRHVIEEIIPAVAEKKLAVFCDVFCEKGFFSRSLSLSILEAGLRFGLKPKIHAEQWRRSGGAQAAALAGAISADHLDYANFADISAMRRAGVIAVLLPASNHYMGVKKNPPAREMISAGLPVALATDFNPGTSPCWNMQFVISLACLRLKMTPGEALCAATVNGALAMGLGGGAGTAAAGAPADLAVFRVKDYREIAYYFGGNLCSMTIMAGKPA